MKCESCKQNEATFFYEENINGVKKAVRLCADCAAKMQGGDSFSFPTFTGLNSDFLNGLFGLSAAPAAEPKKSCPGCHATWSDLRGAGKAFCPQCYTTFGQELEPTLRSLHGGNATHVGRAPEGRRIEREKRDRLANLKAQLAEAIATERFEQAAQLRDQIREIEHNEGGQA